MNSPYLLLVEDNPDDVFIMRRTLKKAGVDIPLHVANDGKEAIDFLREASHGKDDEKKALPLVVFLDLKLPYFNGFEVLEFIREDPLLHDLNVVLLTSSAEERDGRRASELGANAYFVKPPRAEILIGTITPLLEKASATAAPLS